MATADLGKVIRGMTGRLCSGPTNLTLDFPHGGTALGEVRDMEFRWGIRTRLVTAEEYGGQVVEGIYAGETDVLACVLRTWDDDALAAVFPYSAAGNTGHRAIKADVKTDVVRAGSLATARAAKICFSPDSPDQHRFIVLHRAMPLVDESARLQLRLDEEIGIAVVFRGLPDASGLVSTVALRKDVTL